MCPQTMRMIIHINDRMTFVHRSLVLLYEKPGRQKRPGFFVPVIEKIKQGRYVMKFLLAVLAIHFIGEWISNKRKDKEIDNADVSNETVRHPAEFDLR